jgi:hypothetical protein
MGGDPLMHVIATPVYRIGDPDSATYWQGNVYDDDGVTWVVTSEKGWSSGPPVRATSRDRPDRDGAYDLTSLTTYGPRVIELAGTCIAADNTAMNRAKDRFNAVLADVRAAQLLEVEERHVTRHSLVRRNADTLISDHGPLAFDWSLTLFAPDPVRYAADTVTSSTTMSVPLGNGSFTPPLVPPLVLTDAGIGAALQVVNVGNYRSYPIVYVDGPVAAPQVENETTGQVIQLVGDLDLGVRLTYDAAAGGVLVGGVGGVGAPAPGLLHPASSPDFYLAPGLNQINLTSPVYNPNALLTVIYRSGWI